MAADIDIKVVFITFIAEECIALGQYCCIDIPGETCQFFFLGSQTPRVEIKVETEAVHDILFGAEQSAVIVHVTHTRKPGFVTPLPGQGRHDICKHQGI